MSEENLEAFRELATHLDKLPVGFPATESGIELRVLKHLFSPEQARIATKLGLIPEPLKKIYRKFKKEGLTIEELELKLDEMYNIGLINFFKRFEDNGEVKYYSNAPLVIGMFEYQLNRLTKDFMIDMNKYFDEAFMEEFNKPRIPQLRTIPVEHSLSVEQNIGTYDNLRSIIENCGGSIGIAECVCRQGKDILGEPCRKSDLREVCFSFRGAADAYHERGFARLINKEEAYDILGKSEDAGFVIQPGNSQRPFCICLCCGCCCEVLTNQKKQDQPAQFFATNFYAEVDPVLCTGCGVCESRCNMDAILLVDDISTVDLDRCIGCGVCVPTCVNEAITLEKKEKEIVPPLNTVATYRAIMDKKAELARAEK